MLDKVKSNPEIIRTLVNEHTHSPLYLDMVESDEYYNIDNPTIMGRKHIAAVRKRGEETAHDGFVESYYYTQIQEDQTRANNKLPHGFHYELINQCKNFLAGRPVRLSWKDTVITDEFKHEVERLMYVVNDWATLVPTMILNAQKHSRAYLRVSIDPRSSDPRINVVDAKDMIVYKNEFGDIEFAIYLFTKREYDDKGKATDQKFYELITDTESTIYKVGDTIEGLDSTLLLYDKIMLDGEVIGVVPHTWGKVPVVEWKATQDEMTTLKPIKHFIDALDSNLSDYANDLDEFNELMWIVKNYNGEDVGTFLQQAKEDKVVLVDSEGEARVERNELPYQARIEFYNQLIRNVYRFGRGIDFTDRSNLGNITGTGLKWSYELLEEKANDLEVHGQKALDELFELLFKYMSLNGFPEASEICGVDMDFIFDRSLMINEVENIESAVKASVLISKKTALEHMDWVKDVDAELDRLEDDMQELNVPEEEVDNEDAFSEVRPPQRNADTGQSSIANEKNKKADKKD